MNKKGRMFEGNSWVWVLAIIVALMVTGIIPDLFHLSTFGDNSIVDTTDTTQKQAEQTKPIENTTPKYTDTSYNSDSNHLSYFPIIIAVIALIFFMYTYLINKRRREKRIKLLMEEYDGKTKKRRSNLSKGK